MAITPVASYPNILKYGTQAAYSALATKDSDVLYFCTDTKKIYKGTIDFTDSVVYGATTNADVASPIVGKLYVFAGSGTTEVYNGSAWTVVSYPIATSISSTAAANDDVHVATQKAVYDYVASQMAGTDVVKAIAQKTTTDPETSATVPVRGTFTYTTGDDLTHDVQLTGVVTKPSYDATTRTFTFPVAGEADVEVELGTDIFIDPTANNRYENGNIYLYLNDGSASSDPTELVIPVTALVTDYFGDDTASVQVNIDNSTHKVTADVRLKPDITTSGSEWENALKVSTTSGAEGLYVDLSSVETDIATLDANVQALALATTAWGTF